jgi:hypothetical protein
MSKAACSRWIPYTHLTSLFCKAEGSIARGGWNMHQCSGLFIRRRHSSRPARDREITMDQMTRRAFGAASFALLLGTSATFAQQQPPAVRCAAPSKGSMDRC